jgi:hypothetical protein
MSRASTEVETKRRTMLEAVDRMSDVARLVMLRKALAMASSYEMDMLVEATFGDFETMADQLEL